MIVPIILSGGAGTRLWPVSRQAYPKPFMPMPDGESLLRKTLRRAAAVDAVEKVMTVTNRELFFATRDEYAEVHGLDVELDYILEPQGRNTAPAIAMAARRLEAMGQGDAVMLVLAADHLVERGHAFNTAVAQAAKLALRGHLVTFGIKPTHPETGFGYIERGEALNLGAGGPPGFHVKRFVEKPDAETARSYLDSGNFSWNSGMFCFTARAFLAALSACDADMHAQSARCFEACDAQASPFELDGESFGAMENVSVDYAVMEKADGVVVVECDLGWSDIGSWSAFAGLRQPDDAGNRIVGSAVMVNAKNNFVRSDGRLIALVGVEDLVAVDTPDATLVAHKDATQDVKEVVERLRQRGDESYMLHTTVHRPWGTYTVLEEGERFKIKRIVVYPQRELSLQMHHHRSEHWIVVSGTAQVVNGDREFLVRTNESTFIPSGHKHRLSNPGMVDLVMIEVQSGEYLGEDDIVRFDDRYGRS